ncbi:hypothetical protein ACLOJK_036419 [Asimina triloba]
MGGREMPWEEKPDCWQMGLVGGETMMVGCSARAKLLAGVGEEGVAIFGGDGRSGEMGSWAATDRRRMVLDGDEEATMGAVSSESRCRRRDRHHHAHCSLAVVRGCWASETKDLGRVAVAGLLAGAMYLLGWSCWPASETRDLLAEGEDGGQLADARRRR